MHRTQNTTSSAADTDNPSVVTPAIILRGAATYLDRHGWTQGRYYGGTDDNPFPPADTVGAIAMAAYGRRTDDIYTPNTSDTATRDFTRAVDAFCDYLTRYEPTCALSSDPGTDLDLELSPFIWNDALADSATHVTRALRAAANDYDRTHRAPQPDDTEPAELLLDTGGYLACGCHGSQRDHTCGPLD